MVRSPLFSLALSVKFSRQFQNYSVPADFDLLNVLAFIMYLWSWISHSFNVLLSLVDLPLPSSHIAV